MPYYPNFLLHFHLISNIFYQIIMISHNQSHGFTSRLYEEMRDTAQSRCGQCPAMGSFLAISTMGVGQHALIIRRLIHDICEQS